MKLLAALTLAALALPTTANAYTLGIADSATAPVDTQLHATVYRVVIDPALPLESYDARITAHMAAGQQPQIVIGGTGTENHKSTKGLVQAAVSAAKRWPYLFSIGVVNEPDLSGMAVCAYVNTWASAYRSLKALKVKRIPFGEYSPHGSLAWHHAALTRCGKASRTLRGRSLRLAWHSYEEAIDYGRDFRAMHRKLHAKPPALWMTEAGAVIGAASGHMSAHQGDLAGLRYWRKTFRVMKRDHVSMVVVYGLHAAGGLWDSSLIASDGRERPAFALIANR